MEHLPLPEGVEHFIIVPYEAPKKDWYDGKGFMNYPQRRGWTEEQLRGGDDTTKEDYLDTNGFKTKGSESEVEQFFQTWLFFGQVIEFLQIGGIHVQTEDFLVDANIEGENPDMPKMVNTSKLPQLLIQWRNRLRNRGANNGRTWATLRSMFDMSKSILDRFCVPGHEREWPLKQEKPRPWPVRDEISATMIAITFSLRRAAMGSGYVDDVDPLTPKLHGRSELLSKQLQRKWCIADVTTTLKELAIDGHYYLAASPGLSSKELDHHSKCTEEHCLYEYDLNIYVTRHTGSPWHHSGCKPTIQYGGQLGPERGQKDWVDAIGKIIEKDAIPIALWVKGQRKLWSVEYHLTGHRNPDYVAISHVWADGKGNPKANSVPECQLDKITHLVENIHWEGRKPIPSNPDLSDGIGFWLDTICVPVDDKQLKKKAIANMRHVYSRAKAVLVLDDWLEQISSTSPILKIVSRLYQSSWIKRLWTHQEGFLAGISAPVVEGVERISQVYIQFSDRSVELDALNRQWEAYNEQQMNAGIYLQFSQAASMRLLSLYSRLKFIMSGVKDPKDKWKLYAPVADAMSERKTSRLADEIICLSTIINIDVKPFLELPDKDKSDAELAQDRMALFLDTLHTFQMQIVFNNYQRLEKVGYRWAPRSLLNFRLPQLYPGDDQNTSNFQVVNGKRGLLVQYPGFLIQFDNGRPTFGTSDRGCVINYNHRSLKIVGSKVEGDYFIIELPPNNVRWIGSSSQVYAVVLYKVPTKLGQSCAAIVGLSTSSPQNGIYAFEHCSIATARVVNRPPIWVDAVEAPLLASNTKWLVY
ncbi:hypothetical protein EYB26_008445 [Talaromyces marneffei]|uniref:Heterokaryon incompatibility protein 6, OR allele n=1 Tax=Talaromyces marneffei PM1 TaxID=1077442 RepID=A0A093XAU7_TALMA|nr:uncharacterized protein EYB26_008445 [Talaromyces marneffei]QGA20737.1 hypothetical protein EYB26_008445 [Talaromyces marneffei]